MKEKPFEKETLSSTRSVNYSFVRRKRWVSFVYLLQEIQSLYAPDSIQTRFLEDTDTPSSTIYTRNGKSINA